MQTIKTKLLKNISTVALMAIVLMIGACSSSDDPTSSNAEEEMLEDLKNNGVAWTLVSVTKDNFDVADEFTGFTLTIGAFTYATQHSVRSAWPENGDWQFGSNLNTILRDDGVVITTGFTNNQLTLTFNVTGVSEGGRFQGVDGEYVFVLVK